MRLRSGALHELAPLVQPHQIMPLNLSSAFESAAMSPANRDSGGSDSGGGVSPSPRRASEATPPRSRGVAASPRPSSLRSLSAGERRELARRARLSIKQHLKRFAAARRESSSAAAVEWAARAAREYSDGLQRAGAASRSFIAASGIGGSSSSGSGAFSSTSSQRPASSPSTPGPGTYSDGLDLFNRTTASHSLSRSSRSGIAAFGARVDRPDGLTNTPTQRAGLNGHYERGAPRAATTGPGEYDARLQARRQAWSSLSLRASNSESRLGSGSFATRDAKGGYLQELRRKEAASVPSFYAYDALDAQRKAVFRSLAAGGAQSSFKSNDTRFGADERERRARGVPLRGDVGADELGHTMASELRHRLRSLTSSSRRDDLFERCDASLPGGPYRKMVSGEVGPYMRDRAPSPRPRSPRASSTSAVSSVASSGGAGTPARPARRTRRRRSGSASPRATPMSDQRGDDQEASGAFSTPPTQRV